jgi:hypothetical protein
MSENENKVVKYLTFDEVIDLLKKKKLDDVVTFLERFKVPLFCLHAAIPLHTFENCHCKIDVYGDGICRIPCEKWQCKH